MTRVTGDDIQYKLDEINDVMGKKYRLEHPGKKRDWRTYEQEFSLRIKTAMKDLEPLIEEAVSTITIIHGHWHPHYLTLEQRVKLLLIKQIVGEFNGMFANMLDIFSMISSVDVSYKTVERLYSDEEVVLAVHNLHTLILKKNDVSGSKTTGDGTGYSLTVKKNYESYAQKRKDKAKENSGNGKEDDKNKISKIHKKRLFAYSFSTMDLEIQMYVAFGSSIKSEREAYDRAMNLLSSTRIEMDSIRLDRYYSSPSHMDKLGNTKVFVIPKKNATLNGSLKWKNTMKDFVENTMLYLEQYHQRSNSESGFAADKKMLSWNVVQKREDRIDNALFCTGLWHNLFNMGRF